MIKNHTQSTPRSHAKHFALKMSALALAMSVLHGCDNNDDPASATQPPVATQEKSADASQNNVSTHAEKNTSKKPFNTLADRFADIQILRYQVPGFESLDLKKKELLYYLYEAALSGRDIMWDQNNAYNLRVRQLIEEIVRHYSGDRNTTAFNALELYAKQMWTANGIHHHYANDKFTPEFTFDDIKRWVSSIPQSTAKWPLAKDQKINDLLTELQPVIFDPKDEAKKVNKAVGIDKVKQSAVNFYEGVTEEEVEAFYKKASENDGPTPVSHGLNSKLVKENGKLVEKVWKVGGMYDAAITKIVYWLEKAANVAETPEQKKSLELLIQYYKTGDLKTFDDYNIAWVEDHKSETDVVNGFIEVYNDPLGYRGSFESVVSFKDNEATKRIGAIAQEAQWFEDHSPIAEEHKKANVKGIIGKAITVVVESGDASPTTPIGINLPNSNWIRAQHGSKSVSLSNIVAAYNAAKGPTLEEFGLNTEVKERAKKYGELAADLHTDMHEVIGHASGKINDGVKTPKETIKQYASALEEGRADLVALYYLMDPKLVELGVMPNTDVGRAEYDNYLLNGLIVQLYRIKPGENIEEAHMQNRQMIAKWVYEKGKSDNVIEFVKKDEKTFVQINDYDKLRDLFGQLLREIQRIKSEGDFAAAENLIENYGVKVDPQLHSEVLARFNSLDVAPYFGLINPKLTPVMKDGKITDVTISYPESFEQQMLEYSEKYGFLPYIN